MVPFPSHVYFVVVDSSPTAFLGHNQVDFQAKLFTKRNDLFLFDLQIEMHNKEFIEMEKAEKRSFKLRWLYKNFLKVFARKFYGWNKWL